MKIPQILFTVYQHVFNSIYMLSSILNTPYPPPDLLHPMAEKIQIISTPSQSQPEKAEAPVQNATEQPPAQPVTEGASAPPNPATATVAPAVATSEKAATTQT